MCFPFGDERLKLEVAWGRFQEDAESSGRARPRAAGKASGREGRSQCCNSRVGVDTLDWHNLTPRPFPPQQVCALTECVEAARNTSDGWTLRAAPT